MRAQLSLWLKRKTANLKREISSEPMLGIEGLTTATGRQTRQGWMKREREDNGK